MFEPIETNEALHQCKRELSYLAVDIHKGLECHFTNVKLCRDCPYGPHSNDCEAFFAGDLERFIDLTQAFIRAKPEKIPTIMIPNNTGGNDGTHS